MTRQELIDFIRGNVYPNGQNQITAPMVRDAILAVVGFLGDAAVKNVGAVLEFNDGLVTGGDVYNAIRSYVSTVLNLVGETTTDIIEDPTANPVSVDGEPHLAKKGDVVLYGAKEFWWNGNEWKELGDEASWALKTITITGTGDITGGGTLEANRTLDLTQEAKDKLAHGETAFSWFESYLENRLRLKTPYDYLNARKGLILEPDDYATTPADLFKQVVTIDGVETTILRSKLPIVSDSFMSAGGLSANSGSGGGGISLDAMWNSLTNSVPDAYANTPINLAHIPSITVSKVTDIESWIDSKGYMTNADLSNYLQLTGGTMANTNLVVNMNADLLDGYHLTDILASNVASATKAGYVDGTDTGNWDANAPGTYQYLWYYGQSGSVQNFPRDLVGSYGSIVTFLSGGPDNSLHGQIAWGINHSSTDASHGIAWRAKNNLGWDSTWHRLYDDIYHPSADQLTTSRSIWGQSFNGSANVSGAMLDVTSIDSLLYFDTTNGRVGIGVNAPADTLDINGTVHATTLRIGAGAPVLVWDAVNSAWHLSGNFYADGFVSAGGFSDTSGGGGIDLGAMWASLTNSVPDEYANTPIALAHIPDITTAKVSNIESWIDGKGYLTSSAAASTYLTASTAASTYLTIATASSTYQPIISDLSTIRSNANLGASAYSSLSNYLPLSGGTMSNTNLVTNMNADLLDGQHRSYYMNAACVNDPTISADNAAVGNLVTNLGTPSGAGDCYIISFFDYAVDNSYPHFQLAVTMDYQYMYLRNRGWSVWNNWREFAFIDSNVASATSLQTSRSIWGQSFNGTANVSGAMSDVTNIDSLLYFDTTNSRVSIGTTENHARLTIGQDMAIDGPNDAFGAGAAVNLMIFGRGYAAQIKGTYESADWSAQNVAAGALRFYTAYYDTPSERMVIDQYGNVGIGLSIPSYKLDVSGVTRATSFISTEAIAAPFTVASTAVVSNLNADYLDGHHGNYFMNTVAVYDDTISADNAEIGNLVTSTGVPAGVSYVISFFNYSVDKNYPHAQLNIVYDTYQRMFLRNKGWGSWTSWREFAFLDSNVASATALQTSRSIWGQSFNGTADVSGALSGATTGSFSSWVSASYYYVGGTSAYLEYTNSMLHSNVGFYSNAGISAGGLSTSSDARLKTGVQAIDSERAWKVIMGLRPTEFRWIENGEESAGFIAQEVEPIVPFAVKEIGEVKRLNYDNVFTYGIAALRDMKFWRESTDKRIERLERKINELQKELNRLRA